ncbi:hypothetical protein ACOSP7_025073 [Xanthoceras sorbifolium]
MYMLSCATLHGGGLLEDQTAATNEEHMRHVTSTGLWCTQHIPNYVCIESPTTAKVEEQAADHKSSSNYDRAPYDND